MLLRNQLRDAGAQGQIGLVAKPSKLDQASAINQHQRWCPTQALAGHSDRCAFRFFMRIDPDRKADPVFVQKGFERCWCHGRMMLEHGMKADDRDIATVERLFDTLELREPIGNATRAKHLECAEDNHASA